MSVAHRSVAADGDSVRLRLPMRLIATGFGSGYSPIAPATAGTFVAFLVYCALPSMGPLAWSLLLAGLIPLAVVASFAGEAEWGDDPGFVVIDEFVGFFATVFLLPHSVGLGAAAFFLFRFLDIAKPPPARQAERLKGGWGVVADDLVAGIMGNFILRGWLLL